MKYILLLLILASCTEYKQKEITVYMSNGKGWNLSSSQIQVDSVNQTSRTSAEIWINGTKTVIYSERIMISN